MSKIFRLGTDGSHNHTDWQDSNVYPYNHTNLITIEDPDGASARNEITSIPSPFARIDLVKNAFAKVVESKNLDGQTIFHKMVSDALDIGELFFNIDKFQDQIEIITWDARKELNILMQSPYMGHHYLGDALAKYMQSDASTYNFGQLQNIYLLNYKNGPQPLNIIGATSPATLFFSNANDLSYVADTVSFGTDKPFDDEYQPLYRRDFDYVKLWFYMRDSIQGFSKLFPELNDYLEETYKHFSDNEKKMQLRDISQHVQNLMPLSISAANQVEVLGTTLFKKSISLQPGISHFEIRSKRYAGQNPPLVLPIEEGMTYSRLLYTTDQWGKDNRAPYYDAEYDLALRHLPNDGTQHPYLTIGDLLEDTIIRVEHGLNDVAFFNGNFSNPKNTLLTYLLPLRQRFFEFFSAEELMAGFDDHIPMIEMVEVGEGVKVTLRIPIKGLERVRYVEYSRLYFGGNNIPDPNRNEGAIKELSFTGFLMPNVRFANPSEAIYRVGCITTFRRNYSIAFYNGVQSVESMSDCRNTMEENYLKSVTYSVEGKNFEYMQISDSEGYHGVLLPKFRRQQTDKSFRFAVDLGTSNTHIEYVRKGEAEAQTMAFDTDELLTRFFVPKQMIEGKIFNDMEREEGLLEYDYIPLMLGGVSSFHFPTRTVLSHAKGIDWSVRTRPMGLVNLPFTYNSRIVPAYNEVEEDVKWGSDNRLVGSYIENLSLLIRTLVVVKGGSLPATEIVWFYPISMSPKRVNAMSDRWNEVVRSYFGIGSTNRMTESLAPIRYFFDNFATATNLVNIDIGGGTTDIAFARDRQLEFVTSFKFAANDLFESSLDQNPHNGIIDTYKTEFVRLLQSKANVSERLGELGTVLQRLRRPSSVASFLFSLVGNKNASVLDRSQSDFSLRLRENEKGFKVVFVLFYAGIIYHIAQILRLKRLPMPRHITFSGNGSRALNIITNNVDELARFTRIIFHLMEVEGSDGKLEILGLGESATPKESTCKGALLSDTDSTDDRDKIIKLRADGTGFVSSDEVYADIDDAYIAKATDAVETFFGFVLGPLNKAFNLDDYFGVSQETLDMVREAFQNDLDTYIRRGIAIRRTEAGDRDNIDETLFFYPLKGVINVLSEQIARNS